MEARDYVISSTFSLICCILNVALAHIATVGKAMSSSLEEVAYLILRKHDVDFAGSIVRCKAKEVLHQAHLDINDINKICCI